MFIQNMALYLDMHKRFKFRRICELMINEKEITSYNIGYATKRNML